MDCCLKRADDNDNILVFPPLIYILRNARSSERECVAVDAVS